MTDRPGASGDDAAEPMTAKARRTRDRLFHAARVVFERDGFLNARVMDIAVEAKVAHGTFYTYFDSKADIFRAVQTEFQPGIYQPTPADKTRTRIQGIEAGNRQFYKVYLENLRLMALLEQATTFDEEVQALRIQLRRRAERRILGLVKRQQASGALEASLDPEIVASSIIAMTTHSFYSWHVTEDRGYDFEEANKTLTYLWANALGMHAEPEDEEFYQSLGGGRAATNSQAAPSAAEKAPAKKPAKKAPAAKTPAKKTPSAKSRRNTSTRGG